jgi:hypothetical protein
MGIIYREDIIMGMSEVDSGPFAVFAVSSVHSAAGVDQEACHFVSTKELYITTGGMTFG